MMSNFYTTDGAAFSSQREDWETPQELYDELDKEFHFTLDAAANDANHKCEKYYTIADDALECDWGGKAYFSTHHIHAESATGYAKLTTRRKSRIRRLYCSFQRAQTHAGSMSISAVSLKYASSPVASNTASTASPATVHPFPA